MEYKFESVSVNNSQLATEHLNRMAGDGWEPVFFFDMGSHKLGVIFKRYPKASKAPPLVLCTDEPEPQAEPAKRGPGRPKKVSMED